MFSGGDEDVSKYGAVDSDESIREKLVFTQSNVTHEEIIKALSKQIVASDDRISALEDILKLLSKELYKIEGVE